MATPVLPLPPPPESAVPSPRSVPAAPPATPAPLLPPLLTGPTALLWLWILPIGILQLLNLQGYGIVAGNMDARHLSTAHLFGLGGAVNLLVGLTLFVLGLPRFQSRTFSLAHFPSWLVPVTAIAVQAAYLWSAVTSADDLLPRNVTAWIYPTERFVFNQFAFAMLPLALGVLLLACNRPATDVGKTIGRNLALALAAPALLFFVVHSLSAITGLHRLPAVVVAALVTVVSITMFVGLVRALMVGLRRARTWSAHGERVAIFLFALVLPVGGLLLNRSIEFPTDFQAWEVYALVSANTAILLFASFQSARRPLLCFCLLCGTLPFSLYFFIVFLPYTPLSILAIVVFGLGFLILSPTLLFVLHLHLLNEARRNPLLRLPARHLALAGLGCALILPGYFTARAFGDKAALHAALDYVYSPALARGDLIYPASLANLRRALDSHRSYKNGITYPLLSDYYAWLVFDRLILPDDKLAALEKTFFGTVGSSENTDLVRNRRNSPFGGRSVRDQSRMPRANPLPRTVAVSALTLAATPVDSQNTTVTVALTLTHTGPSSSLGAEYLKTLPLPPGILVNGFRLDVNGTPTPGRIFEKKTALWVYTMIRDSERRDPGLLYYRQPDELELRVFPVNHGTPSHVEIDFLVPRPLASSDLPTATSDPAAVLAQLGALLSPQLTHDPRGSVAAGGLDHLGLPAVDREPYLHVIVDRSRDGAFTGDLPAALRRLKEKFPAARLACVTLAHHDVTDYVANLTPLDDLIAGPAPNLERLQPASGGLALDLALARAIRQHRDGELDQGVSIRRVPPRPVFVILSAHAAARPLVLDRTAAWTDLLPSLELHEAGADRTWFTHLAAPPSSPLLRLGSSIRPLVSNRPARFKPAEARAPLEFWSPAARDWQHVSGVALQPATTPWSRAIALQLLQQDHSRSPGDTGFDLKSVVNASRDSGVLLPATSYIVVENSAQRRMLEESERQKLGQNAALAFRETPAPSALWLCLAFIPWVAFRRRRSFAALRLRSRPGRRAGGQRALPDRLDLRPQSR